MGFVSKRLRDSAKGQDCTLRLPCCNHDPETTVLGHLPSPVKGMANKGDDWHAVFTCSACHAALDIERGQINMLEYYCLHALQRTQKFWFDNGYLTIAGDKEPKARSTSSKSLPAKKLFGG